MGPMSHDMTSFTNPISGSGFSTEKGAAVIVLGMLVVLTLINRGFRGISAGGISVGVH